ncbi:MAG: YceI family protein [Planctomycetes bacterium]|nr:YceI family protein [Planctomycetota bacterium]
MKHLIVASLTASILLALSACSDPLANVAKANVAEAKEVKEEKATGLGKELKFSHASGGEIKFMSGKRTADHPGGFSEFAGKLVTTDDGKGVKQVELEIKMDSIWSSDGTDGKDKTNVKLTGHLKSADFFNVEKYPTAKFVSTEIKEGGSGATHTVTGNLTIMETTKSVTFPATIKVDGGKVTATAPMFKINRNDWGITYKGMADNLIKDDVGIEFEIRTE